MEETGVTQRASPTNSDTERSPSPKGSTDQGPATAAETTVGDGNEVSGSAVSDDSAHSQPVACLDEAGIDGEAQERPVPPQSTSPQADSDTGSGAARRDSERVDGAAAAPENVEIIEDQRDTTAGDGEAAPGPGSGDDGGANGSVESAVGGPGSDRVSDTVDEPSTNSKSPTAAPNSTATGEQAQSSDAAKLSAADTETRPVSTAAQESNVNGGPAESSASQPGTGAAGGDSHGEGRRSSSSDGAQAAAERKKIVTLPAGLRDDEPAGAATNQTPEEEEAASDMMSPIQRGKSFAVSYMGSTQLIADNPLSKSMRVTLAYEAVSRVKQPEGEPQPLIPVNFIISTESVRIIHRVGDVMLMDHPLRSISYVADIGRLVVVMARRRFPQQEGVTGAERKSKLLCHVLEADDAHHISETIGFAFNFAYREFLQQNGIDEESLAVSDYADILSVQRMPQDELDPFLGKDGEDEFQLVKKKGEPIGVSVMESGWGSMIPTVTISHLQKGGAAGKSNRINVGDQLLAVAGKSLVGIPIPECLEWLKSLRYLTMVKVKLIHTPPVVDVSIVRPDLKFPLGFSVLDGTVTSLLRGSIGERGGIRVGHHIIEINSQSTVKMKPEQLLDMLSTSTGHIHLKTMSLHLYRIMTGEVQPEYV